LLRPRLACTASARHDCDRHAQLAPPAPFRFEQPLSVYRPAERACCVARPDPGSDPRGTESIFDVVRKVKEWCAEQLFCEDAVEAGAVAGQGFKGCLLATPAGYPAGVVFTLAEHRLPKKGKKPKPVSVILKKEIRLPLFTGAACLTGVHVVLQRADR
jgi:hypothetical protein